MSLQDSGNTEKVEIFFQLESAMLILQKRSVPNGFFLLENRLRAA